MAGNHITVDVFKTRYRELKISLPDTKTTYWRKREVEKPWRQEEDGTENKEDTEEKRIEQKRREENRSQEKRQGDKETRSEQNFF